MGDDWETEPDFVNDVSEREQRWGSKTVPGSGRQAYIDMHALREEVQQADRQNKLKTAPKPSYGYGGKFGVERDRMDKSAVGHDHVEVVEKHASQKDHSLGFGGKFGVQSDRQDKSAVGWDQKEQTEKHASQKDYSVGFGGKYGVQKDRQDASAVGWDHREKTAAHSSQTDYSKGFGGKYGVQTDRMDTTSSGASEDASNVHPSQMQPEIRGQTGGISALRSQFESKGSAGVVSPGGLTAAQQRIAEERARWEAERKTSGANAPPAPAEIPARQSVNEPVAEPARESLPVHHPEPVVEPTPPTLAREPEPIVEPPPPTSTDYGEYAEQAYDESNLNEAPMLTVVAQYDYTAEEEDELTFSAGELITEVEKLDPGWWKGVCRGKLGLFPSNYVQEQ